MTEQDRRPQPVTTLEFTLMEEKVLLRLELDAARRELAELEAEVRYEFNLQNPDDFGPAIARALRRGES